MPKSSTDTPTTELLPSEADNSATPKWDKVEQERLTRRAALRKMGYTSGIALFSLFAVDDLARMAIQKMEQHKETRQIAETVAKEFKNAGIALAGPNSYNDPCAGSTQQDCQGCNGNRQNTCDSKAVTVAETNACNSAATKALQACNAPGGPDWTGFGNAWQDCGPILARH